MRKFTILKEPVNEIKKIVLYESSDGVYVFLYNTTEDVRGISDYFFDNLEEAEEICLKNFNVNESDWIFVNDPIEYCQHDIISPVRIKGRDLGLPQWGKYEKLVNGKWVEYEIKRK